jgi:hypothetical protein
VVPVNPLVWLSGADRRILRRCRTDRAKYVGIGGAMLVTAGLAGASASFAAFTALRVALPTAIVIGCLWAVAILTVDRWLVSSIQRRDHWYQNLLPALARLGLAVLIGFVVSTPLVLRVFHPEIDAQVRDIQRVAREDFQSQLENGDQAKTISTLSGERDRLNKIVATADEEPDISGDPEVRRLQGLVNDYTTKLAAAREAQLCEGDGSCGTHEVGEGAAYREKKAVADSLDTTLKAYEGQLVSAKAAASAGVGKAADSAAKAAAERLVTVNAKLKTLQDQQTAAQGTFNQKNDQNTGLLIQIEALNQITRAHPDLGLAHRLLLLFITAFECLPVLVKFMLSLGPPTTYEKAVAAFEREQLAAEERLARQRRAVQLLDSEDELVEARVARDAKDHTIERLTKASIEAQERVARATLAGWEERELARARRQRDHLFEATFDTGQ